MCRAARVWTGLVLAVVALTGLLAAAHAGPGLTRATFRLNWLTGGVHTGFYVALDRGYYAREGLDVQVLEGRGSGTTVRLIGSKSDDIGLADAGSAVIGAAQGIPVKVVAELFQVNAFAVIAMADSGIKRPKDLEGKRVGVTPGDALSQLWPALVGANGIDADRVTLVSMDPAAKMPALIQKQVDAFLGGADDQAVTLRQRGFNVAVLRFSEFGVPTIGLSIVAHPDTVRDRPGMLRGFIRASARGWDEARKRPDESVRIHLKYFPNLDFKVTRDQLDVAISSLFSAKSSELFKATDEDWRNHVVLLARYMGLTGQFGPRYYYTREVMPESLPPK